MSRILLLNIDGPDPNLAIMQIAAYHKARGDEVSLNTPNDPNKVYISCIFKENRAQAMGDATYYPDAEVIVGGSGINYNWLPEEMQNIKPDYSLYDGKICQRCGRQVVHCKCKKGPKPGNMFYSIGFSTRGCIRHCAFCIVHDKEGAFRKWQDIEVIHDPRHKVIKLLDNNILANEEHFFKVTDYILEHRLKWDPTQGLDFRLLTPAIAARLKEMKWQAPMKFAFDNVGDEPAVLRGIKMLKDAGIDTHHGVMVYVLVGFDSSEEDDKHRCRLLKENDVCPFVMVYKESPWTNKIGRWANRKELLWSCDIDDWQRSKEGK